MISIILMIKKETKQHEAVSRSFRGIPVIDVSTETKCVRIEVLVADSIMPSNRVQNIPYSRSWILILLIVKPVSAQTDFAVFFSSSQLPTIHNLGDIIYTMMLCFVIFSIYVESIQICDEDNIIG